MRRLGSDPRAVAAALMTKIRPEDVKAWSQGTPVDCAREVFTLARDDAYGLLPSANDQRFYGLRDSYVETATADVDLQLRQSGLRLATILNTALGSP